MAYIRDADAPEELDDYRPDESDLYCPNKHCGCNDVAILRYPKPGGWFGGKAQCNFCGCKFSIFIEEDAGPAPTAEMVCPSCGFVGEADGRQGNYRARCPQCGADCSYKVRR